MIIPFAISGDTPTSVTMLALANAVTGAPITVSPALPQTITYSGGAIYSFTTPANGLSYAYAYRLNWSDGTSTPSSAVITDPSGVTGYYSTQALLQVKFGSVNTDTESDLNGIQNGSANAAKYLDVLTETDIWVNRQLRSAGYVYPLALTSADFPAVQVIATRYGRALLHIPRGAEDDNKKAIAGQMNAIMDKAECDLQVMLSPLNVFDCPQSSTTQTGPEVGHERRGRFGYQPGYYDQWQGWG